MCRKEFPQRSNNLCQFGVLMCFVITRFKKPVRGWKRHGSICQQRVASAWRSHWCLEGRGSHPSRGNQNYHRTKGGESRLVVRWVWWRLAATHSGQQTSQRLYSDYSLRMILVLNDGIHVRICDNVIRIMNWIDNNTVQEFAYLS